MYISSNFSFIFLLFWVYLFRDLGLWCLHKGYHLSVPCKTCIQIFIEGLLSLLNLGEIESEPRNIKVPIFLGIESFLIIITHC